MVDCGRKGCGHAACHHDRLRTNTPTTEAHRLTESECARIVHASIRSDRVLAGPNGHDGGPPDVLLSTVEAILAKRLAAAEAQAQREARREFGERLAREARERGDIGRKGCVEAWDWLDIRTAQAELDIRARGLLGRGGEGDGDG